MFFLAQCVAVSFPVPFFLEFAASSLAGCFPHCPVVLLPVPHCCCSLCCAI